MTTMKSDIVDIEVRLHFETEKAIRVSADGDDDTAEWIPKSLVEVEYGRGGLATITLPEHIANEKGLI